MAGRTSLKDIAQAVGVSTTLVSYVLNNQKENRIGKEVARRIRQVAEELNYRPNQIARSLKTSKTRTLGLIIADIANPFSSQIARVVEDEADQRQYTVIFGSSEEKPQRCHTLIDALLNRQVDGLLISAPAGSEPYLKSLLQRKIPFVLLDRFFPTINAHYVGIDNCRATYDAVQQLADAGFQRIGLVTFRTSLAHMRERTRGYHEALRNRSLPASATWIHKINSTQLDEEIAPAIRKLISGPEPVDAIVFTTNILTVKGLTIIRELGLHVPQQVAVVGFDETDAYGLFQTSVSYVRQPIQEIARRATQLLLQSIDIAYPPAHVALPATLVVQNSSRSVSN